MNHDSGLPEFILVDLPMQYDLIVATHYSYR